MLYNPSSRVLVWEKGEKLSFFFFFQEALFGRNCNNQFQRDDESLNQGVEESKGDMEEVACRSNAQGM